MSMCIHTWVRHTIDISIEMFHKMIILLEHIDHHTFEMQIQPVKFLSNSLPIMLALFQLPMMLKVMLVLSAWAYQQCVLMYDMRLCLKTKLFRPY